MSFQCYKGLMLFRYDELKKLMFGSILQRHVLEYIGILKLIYCCSIASFMDTLKAIHKTQKILSDTYCFGRSTLICSTILGFQSRILKVCLTLSLTHKPRN